MCYAFRPQIVARRYPKHNRRGQDLDGWKTRPSPAFCCTKQPCFQQLVSIFQFLCVVHVCVQRALSRWLLWQLEHVRRWTQKLTRPNLFSVEPKSTHRRNVASCDIWPAVVGETFADHCWILSQAFAGNGLTQNLVFCPPFSNTLSSCLFIYLPLFNP